MFQQQPTCLSYWHGRTAVEVINKLEIKRKNFRNSANVISDRSSALTFEKFQYYYKQQFKTFQNHEWSDEIQ